MNNQFPPEIPVDAASTRASSLTRRSLLRSAAGLIGGLFLPALTRAEDLWTTYQTPAAFLTEAFGATPPPPKVLMLDAAAQAKIGAAFGRAYPQAQIRYWKANGRSAWITASTICAGTLPS